VGARRKPAAGPPPEGTGARARATSGQANGGDAPGRELAFALSRALDEVKAEDLKMLDVHGLTDVTDFMVLATSTGERHLKALAGAAREAVRSAGRSLLGTEGEEASGWIVVDAGEVVAHLFTRRLRAYYDLDGLWADARPVELDERQGSEGR
jgi:ribosome-associated protein